VTRALYRVQQPRVRKVIYERLIWADSPEEAIIKADTGTAWPQSYDERTVEVEHGDWSAAPETDEYLIEVWKESND
jgi:hypothetical protein